TRSVYFEVQMPHSWVGGTSKIYPHVHWAPTTTNTGTCRWVFEYTWVDINGTFGTSTTYVMDGAASSGTAWKHYIVGAGGITPSGTQGGVSTMMICRLYREGGNAADTYTGNACLIAFDIHFEKDTEGSRTEFTK
ncbi:MAG: hypothetical protein WCR42_15905, partial [bacterium]